MDETDAHAPRRTDGTLVATSVVIAAVDLLYLGVAVTFGPSGFGGDSDLSGSEVAAADARPAAGPVGCLLAAGGIGAFAPVIVPGGDAAVSRPVGRGPSLLGHRAPVATS